MSDFVMFAAVRQRVIVIAARPPPPPPSVCMVQLRGRDGQRLTLTVNIHLPAHFIKSAVLDFYGVAPALHGRLCTLLLNGAGLHNESLAEMGVAAGEVVVMYWL